MAASRQCGLTEAQRGRFTQMLVDLEPSRANIGDVMVWCLQHADAASDITDCVVEALRSTSSSDQPERSPEIKDLASESSDENKTKPPLSISKAVARLFLISDILYNSSAKVPNASYFRKCFERRLPDVFISLHGLYESVDGKLKAEQLKQKVMLCFHAWDDWAIYPNDYLIKLQNIFLGLIRETEDESDLAGVPLELDGPVTVEATMKTLASDPDVEILQGQPLVQYDGDPLDVDGSPLDESEQDDEPVIKKSKRSVVEAKAASPNRDPTSTRLFVPSKWETVDPQTVEAQALTTTSRWELVTESSEAGGTKNSTKLGRWEELPDNSHDDELDGQPLTGMSALVAYDDEDAISPMSSESETSPLLDSIPLPPRTSSNSNVTRKSVFSSSLISEERRAMLREIESKVLKYQDELEATRKGDKSITDEAINKQIQRYRERLLERLQDERLTSPEKKYLSAQKFKSSYSKDNFTTDAMSPRALSSKRPRREHSISPPASRDCRDRSPPRSFREHDRSRRRPPSNSPNVSSETDAYDTSPFNNSRNLSLPSNEADGDSRQLRTCVRERNSRSSPQRRLSVQNEELEEGEASDDEDSSSVVPQRILSKRSHQGRDSTHNATTPKHSRKRHHSRSPDPIVDLRHARRSRTPSPNRKRSELSTGSSSRHRKK